MALTDLSPPERAELTAVVDAPVPGLVSVERGPSINPGVRCGGAEGEEKEERGPERAGDGGHDGCGSASGMDAMAEREDGKVVFSVDREISWACGKTLAYENRRSVLSSKSSPKDAKYKRNS